MRQRKVIALIGMDELDSEVCVQAVMLAARWVYFHPPKLVFEPKKRPEAEDESWRSCREPIFLAK